MTTYGPTHRAVGHDPGSHSPLAASQDSTPERASGPQRATSAAPADSVGAPLGAPPDFLSEAQCQALMERLGRYATGGGYTAATIWSTWSGHVRWARNQIITSGEVRQTFLRVYRDLQGANYTGVVLNETTDVALVAAARRAERLARLTQQQPQWELVREFPPEPLEPEAKPRFSPATAALTAEQRATAALTLAREAEAAGVLSAGYIEVGTHSLAMLDTLGNVRYCPYTTASYSVTVRDPHGQGVGWAGVDWPDWSQVDASHLTQLALDKCLKSRNPVKVEPGRYTTILEPQAVGDFVGQLVNGIFARSLGMAQALRSPGPFTQKPPDTDDILGRAKFGKRVIDARLTLSADPRDPELSFLPWAPSSMYLLGGEEATSADNWRGQDVYHPVTWIENGVLTNLAYARDPSGGGSVEGLQRGRGLPNSGAFRLSVTGPTTSLAEMIATTTRGILVTRFANISAVYDPAVATALLCRGYTRDGLWLIENGALTRPIQNFMFVESLLSVLNRVEQVGVPQRIYHPQPGFVAPLQPEIVPPLKIRDFCFTALMGVV